MNLKPISLVGRLVTKGPKARCFLSEEYSALKASNHWGQSRLALASSSIKISTLEVIMQVTKVSTKLDSTGVQRNDWSESRRDKRSLWRLRRLVHGTLGEGRTASRSRPCFLDLIVTNERPILGNGLLVTLKVLLKPSDSFSTRELICRSL